MVDGLTVTAGDSSPRMRLACQQCARDLALLIAVIMSAV